MKKEEQVVIIPTDKASCIHRNNVKTDSGYEYRLTYHETPSKCKNDGLLSGNQHLYITIDGAINVNVGDWVIWRGGVYNHSMSSFTGVEFSDCKKIIATTDPKLRSDSLIEDPARPEDNLLIRKGIPQIPQSLIESYCKNPVDKVEVEYEWWQDQDNTGAGIENIGEPELILKLTSNNEIIISVIEERLYDRDEMLQKI